MARWKFVCLATKIHCKLDWILKINSVIVWIVWRKDDFIKVMKTSPYFLATFDKNKDGIVSQVTFQIHEREKKQYNLGLKWLLS